MIDSRENAVWKIKFVDLNQHLQKIEIETESDGSDIPAVESRAENIILSECNSQLNSFKTIKRFAIAFLTLFGSSYLSKCLFSHINFIKSRGRNCFSPDLIAACVTLKTTHHEPRIIKLAEKMQQQVAHRC